MPPTRLVLVLVTLLLIAPTLAAQQPVGSELFINMRDLPDTAPGQTRTEQINITYRWENGAVTTEDTEVTVNVSAEFGPLDPWAQVSVAPQTLTFTPDAQMGQTTKSVDLTVAVDPGAPAVIPAEVTVAASASQNGAIASSEDVQTGTAHAAPVYDVLARPPAEVDLSDGPTTVEIPVTNAGNGPVGVWLANVSVPEGVTAIPGERLVLGPGGAVQANADQFDVEEAVRQQLAADPEGVLELRLEGSGSGTMDLQVAYGPAGNASVVVGGSTTQLRIQGGGLPLVPLLALLLLAAAVGTGYYVLREDEEDEASGTPVLTPLDSDEVDEANEGETWLEVPADEEE